MFYLKARKYENVSAEHKQTIKKIGELRNIDLQRNFAFTVFSSSAGRAWKPNIFANFLQIRIETAVNEFSGGTVLKRVSEKHIK